MPDRAREMTQAREIYAFCRGAADRSAARPRPLDAPVALRRRQFPLLLETLAWHFLHCEPFRDACRQHEWTPKSWHKRLLEGQSPAWTIPLGEERSCSWGRRSLRRWGHIIQNSLRQLRIFPSTARFLALTADLANLQGWYQARQAQKLTGDTVYLCRPEQLPECAPRKILRLAVLGGQESLDELSRLSGVESRRILRFQRVGGHYLPLCRHGAIHLPRPLLALCERDTAPLLWNTLAAGEKSLSWPTLPGLPQDLRKCTCGLSSWSFPSVVNKQT